MTKRYPKNPQAWRVNLGDDVGLPNICDRNCAGCYDDFGSTSLRDSPPDRRRDLYKALGENWFPSTWKLKPKWRTAIQDHFKNSAKSKLFLFTGRGDPLFYLPCIEAYMKTYKELGYTGYASVSTSASLLDKKKLNFLINIGNLIKMEDTEGILLNYVAIKNRQGADNDPNKSAVIHAWNSETNFFYKNQGRNWDQQVGRHRKKKAGEVKGSPGKQDRTAAK